MPDLDNAQYKLRQAHAIADLLAVAHPDYASMVDANTLQELAGLQYELITEARREIETYQEAAIARATLNAGE